MRYNRSILDEATLCLHGSLNELDRLTAAVTGFCEKHALDADAEFQLNLVLEELFVNSIRHGGCENLAEAACVSLQLQGGEVRVVYSDRGIPFDPTAAPEPDLTAPLEERTIGGLGVHLVRQIMSGIEYRREPNRNILAMKYPLPTQQETV